MSGANASPTGRGRYLMKISFSVRSFLVFLAISFTVPAVVIFAVFEARSGVEHARERASETNRLAALLIQRDTLALFQELKGMTEGLAAGLEGETLRFSHPERVKPIMASHPGSVILIFNEKGISVASYAADREIPIGLDYSERDYIKNAIRIRKPVVSGPVPALTSNRPVLVFCVPLLDGAGNVRGLLGGAFPTGRFRPVSVLPPEQFAFLFDSQGGVISSVNAAEMEPLVSQIWTAPAGESQVGSAGIQAQVHVVELEPIGWKVVVGLPERHILALTRGAIYRAAFVGLLCTLIGAGIASIVALSTVRGVDDFSQQIRKMSAADLKPIRLSETRMYPREVRTAADNFNQLLERTARMRVAEFEAISRVGDTILIADADGLVTYVNEAGTRLLGGVAGAPLKDIVGEVTASAILSQKAPREWKGDATVRKAHGAAFDGFVSSTPVFEDGQLTSVVIIVQDITREKAAREAFIQSEKMITLGELVAGTSHELNNPLAIVTGYADLLLEEDTLRPEQRSKIESIRKSALRASNVVHSLLAFARKRKPERVPTDVNNVIDAALQLKEYDIKTSGIRLEKHLAENLPSIYADPHQIQQVLLNVINNAQDATLETTNIPVITVRSEARGGSVSIRIEDTGTGISREDLKKVFDPFFTTKPLGKGTGLGLSISYGIIREHGGEIEIQSQPGAGTQVSIELPVGRPVESGPRMDLQRLTEISPKQFLVVDDEVEIASIIETALSRSGCTVDSASSIEDAMRFAHEKDYDLVITDVKMPRGNGIDLYKQLCSWNPAYRRRVVFITGDTNNPATMQFIESHGLPYFSKPFDFQTLETFLTNAGSLPGRD